ncbi:MAG: alpha/beta hydrolase [Acidobacteria bacterium]|nr:MAG: alpha/beta hydrolase [Acidobacteriota bacterium]
MVKLLGDEYAFSPNYLEIDGNKYHYLDEGDKNAPVLLMVHGNPTWSFYYRKLVRAFSDSHRVIVPDHIGCGLSDKPQGYSYRLRNHIDNLKKLIDHLQLKDITLIVHDWGGAIGMGAAVDNPKLFKQFVIFNTAAFFVPRLPLRIQMCRVPVLGSFLVRGLNGFSLAALWFATSRHNRFTKAVRKGYVAPYNSWENRIAIHAFVKDIPMHESHPTRKTLNHIESGLTAFSKHPMLIIWGADDFCFTKRHFVPEWKKRFPEADVHILENTGHYVVEDAHEFIVPLMEKFLREKGSSHD